MHVIAQIPGVKYISPDRTVQKHLDLTAATVGATLPFSTAGPGRALAWR